MRVFDGTFRHLDRYASTGRRAGRQRPVASVRARRVEVSVPRRVPPAAHLHPLLTLFVEEAETAKAAPLRALFALLDRAGAVEVNRRTHARTSWHIVGATPAQIALRLEISDPPEARGEIDVVIQATDYQCAWEAIRDSHWVGITSPQRLQPRDDGSVHLLDEAFTASLAFDADPPPPWTAIARAADQA